MASGSNFTGFSDSLADTVTADWYVGLHLPRGPGFLAFENGVPPYNTFGGSETIPFPTYGPSRTSYLEIPPRTPYTLGVTQDTIRPLQPPYDAHNALSTTSHNQATGTELWITGLTQSPVGALHILSPVPTQPPTPSPLVPTSWVKLPQINYDRGGRQWNYRSSEPTSFSVNGRPGVNMRDALRKEFTGFDGRDDPVLQGAASAISCRLLFPGYPANNNSCQIHVLDWTRNRLPITRSKLAHEIAKKVERYLDHISKYTFDGSVDDRWRVGRGFMHIENMFLVRLVSVSRGSFQPEIWVADPSVPRALGGWE